MTKHWERFRSYEQHSGMSCENHGYIILRSPGHNGMHASFYGKLVSTRDQATNSFWSPLFGSLSESRPPANFPTSLLYRDQAGCNYLVRGKTPPSAAMLAFARFRAHTRKLAGFQEKPTKETENGRPLWSFPFGASQPILEACRRFALLVRIPGFGLTSRIVFFAYGEPEGSLAL